MDATRIIVRQTGGPEVLEWESFEPRLPGPGEVLIRQDAIGVNYIDTYQRSGLYPVPLPFTPGSEAAGVVVAVGQGVTTFAEGDAVAYLLGPPGAYASHRVMAVDRLIRQPASLSAEAAAALLLKGCTVEMLTERCAPVRAADWVLVHAAAGGVGSLLVPWLKALGANVVAHAGTAEKADRARKAGADVSLSCAMGDIPEAVRDATGGVGVRIVYDGVGKASWAASLASMARRGILVSFGNASGSPDPVGVLDLMRAGSIYLTRPTLADYVDAPADRQHSAARVFAMIENGVLPTTVGRRFALDEAEAAHRALEARSTTGSVVLIP